MLFFLLAVLGTVVTCGVILHLMKVRQAQSAGGKPSQGAGEGIQVSLEPSDPGGAEKGVDDPASILAEVPTAEPDTGKATAVAEPGAEDGLEGMKVDEEVPPGGKAQEEELRTKPPLMERPDEQAKEETASAIEEVPAAEEEGSDSGEIAQEPQSRGDRGEGEAKRPEPGKRGGRPRVAIKDLDKASPPETGPRQPKAEIVCLKKERRWILAVELPEYLLGNPGLAVRQNGLLLRQDEFTEERWHLNQAGGEVAVTSNKTGDSEETKIGLGQENYLLFKLSGENQNQGRRVKRPSSGDYLVIAPDSWKRDEELCGQPPVTPEPVSLEGYQAHFFYFDKKGDSKKIAFRTPEDNEVVIEPNISRFELVGTRLNDASENIGPLFGEKPPQIRALDDRAWASIGTIVVGEEGGGQKKWRTNFPPDPAGTIQELPQEVVDREGGWYFIRFYDTNDELVESLDFRFLRALREIRTPPLFPLPPEDGHKAVSVQLLHERGCAVQPLNAPGSIQIERQDDRTILTIRPDPACDQTRWCAGPEPGPWVEVTILVERVWWTVSEEDNMPSQWGDEIIALSRKDFAATSNKVLWLRLPRRRWVDEVLLGFEDCRAKRYVPRVMERTVSIPLRDFCDSQEVGECNREHRFKVWIKHNDAVGEEVIAVVPVLRPPPIACWIGRGRKKTAAATAKLRTGSGEMKVNGQPLDDYFKRAPRKARRFIDRLCELDGVIELLPQMEVCIEVTGSSPTTTRQAKAAAHALARGLMSYDPKLTPLLKQAGFGHY